MSWYDDEYEFVDEDDESDIKAKKWKNPLYKDALISKTVVKNRRSKKSNLINNVKMEKPKIDTHFNCHHCGRSYAIGIGININGNLFCPACVIRCDGCNAFTVKDKVKRVAYFFDRGNAKWANYCPDCANKCKAQLCSYCETYCIEEYIWLKHNDDLLCESCKRKSHFLCNECNLIYHNDDRHAGDYCPNCAEEEDVGNDPHNYEGERLRDGCKLILAYEAKPLSCVKGGNAIVKKIGENIHLPYMGVELEVSAVDGKYNPAASAIQKALGEIAILKFDRSVKYGFEICTIPMTLQEHYKAKEWDLFFTDVAPKFVKRDSVAFNCGMHVHLNRLAFNAGGLSRFISFIHRKENREFVCRIAERVSDKFANLVEKDAYIHMDRDEDRIRGHKKRHEAVNLCNNSTVELRIFASIVEKYRFFKNLEFCEALYRYCHSFGNIEELDGYGRPTKKAWEKDNAKLSNKLLSDAFCEWVMNQKQFPNLADFIEKECMQVENKFIAAR